MCIAFGVLLKNCYIATSVGWFSVPWGWASLIGVAMDQGRLIAALSGWESCQVSIVLLHLNE